ncbi:hypothetical protein EJB05_02161, partial [Eragrostis curvula]
MEAASRSGVSTSSRDVLRVTGLHNTASQFTIVGRRNVLLSIEFDKTDEADLQCAVECASSALLQPRGAAVLDYTSQESTDSIPGHYVMHILVGAPADQQ